MILTLLRFLRTIVRDAQLYAMLAGELRLRRLNRTLSVGMYVFAFGCGWSLMEVQEHLLWAAVAWVCLVTATFCLGGKVVIDDELNRRCAETLDFFERAAREEEEG